MTADILAVDLFAGAGGTSTGLTMACKETGKTVKLTAINHWPVAISTHERNHPWASHICAAVESVNPREVVPGGHLDILVASPECTHFSCAAGGRPKLDQKRASAWQILRWLELLRVDSLLVENVPEFRSWGPLDAKGQQIRKLQGATFRAWISAVRSLGYNLDYRVLNAADYGDATSRRRLFVVARKGRRPVTWPEPLYNRSAVQGRKKWRAARDIIDWTIEGQSIFSRSKPLSPRTMRRIIAGLKKFSGPELRPFLVLMENGGGVRSIDEPLPTITTARGGSMGVAEPFLLSQGSGGAPRSTASPVPTIPAGGAHALVEPFLVEMRGTSYASCIDDPVPAITGIGHEYLAEPCLVEYYGNGGSSDIDDPVPTVTTKDRFGLVQPVIDGKALDIRFRMLRPNELAAAMGFPAAYRFTGTKTDQVRQIGNAVAVNIARALCLSLISCGKMAAQKNMIPQEATA